MQSRWSVVVSSTDRPIVELACPCPPPPPPSSPPPPPHCGASLPAWTLASTHCGPLPSPPASHCASQPLISQSIFLLPQSLPQTYLPDLLEDPLWHVQPACFSQLLASTYSPIYLPSSILHVPTCVQKPPQKSHHRCHRHCHDHVHDQLK